MARRNDSRPRGGGRSADPEGGRGERRKHDRVPAEILVEVETSGQRTYRRTANISQGGLAFHAPIPFRRGSRVRMILRLAGREGKLPVQGEVVGTDETGRGTRVRFVELSETARAVLREHVKLFEAPTVVGGKRLRRSGQSTRPGQVREGLLLCRLPAGVEFRLRGADKVIGRDRKLADIVIDHPTVSRRHAHVYLQNGRHVITDLSSTNGIHYRHQPVHTLVLADGMVFHVGAVELEYLVTRKV